MTFLPIIERELRVRARRRASYWTRFGVALGGLLICLPQLMLSGSFGAPGAIGKGTFDGIVAAAFLLSCGACLLTADAITAEQKEGTLGLLFLTRVKAMDVLLGKLGSVGFTSLCSLLACVPVMIIPILAGGVTGGEALRKGLALFATLGFALAVGLWAATSRRKAGVMRNALGTILLTILVPFGLWQFTPHKLRGFGVLSPLVAVISAGDSTYRSAGGWYWTSLVGSSVLAGIALVAAGRGLRRATEPETEAAPTQRAPFTIVGKNITARVRWEPQQNEAAPVAWLVGRQPGLRVRLWAAAILALLYQGGIQFWMPWFGGAATRSMWAMMWIPSLAISALEGALITWAASRFFVEGRRTAELEVLLTTPVGARTVVADQWKVLRRLLRGPVLLMLIPPLLRFLYLTHGMPGTSRAWVNAGYQIQFVVSQILSVGAVLLHVAALCWLGMWFGLKARGQASAIVWSVGLVTGGTYLLSILWWGVFAALSSWFFGNLGGWSYVAASTLPQIMVLALPLALILWARNRLQRELAGAAPARFALGETVSEATTALRNSRHWTPS